MFGIKSQKKFAGSLYDWFPVNFTNRCYFNRLLPMIFVILFFIISGFQLSGKTFELRNEFSTKLQDMKNFDAMRADDTSELIVQFKTSSEIYVDANGNIVSGKGADTGFINDLLKKHQATIKPIGSKLNSEAHKTPTEFLNFFIIKGKGNLEVLRQELLKTEIIDSAYIKPPSEDPGFQD